MAVLADLALAADDLGLHELAGVLLAPTHITTPVFPHDRSLPVTGKAF